MGEPLPVAEADQPAGAGDLVVREPEGRALLAVAVAALVGLFVAVVALLPGMRIGRGRRWSANSPLTAWRERTRARKEEQAPQRE